MKEKKGIFKGLFKSNPDTKKVEIKKQSKLISFELPVNGMGEKKEKPFDLNLVLESLKKIDQSVVFNQVGYGIGKYHLVQLPENLVLPGPNKDQTYVVIPDEKDWVLSITYSRTSGGFSEWVKANDPSFQESYSAHQEKLGLN